MICALLVVVKLIEPRIFVMDVEILTGRHLFSPDLTRCEPRALGLPFLVDFWFTACLFLHGCLYSCVHESEFVGYIHIVL